MKAKRRHNIFNEIITENFPNLGKTMTIQVQGDSRTTLTKTELLHDILSSKQQVQRLEK
jgi:hypothetical protein